MWYLLSLCAIFTISFAANCGDVIPNGTGTLIDNCYDNNNCAGTEQMCSCQRTDFTLGDSGRRSYVVNCGNSAKVTVDWTFNANKSNIYCDFYTINYYFSTTDDPIYTRSECWEQLTLETPFLVMKTSCGEKNGLTCEDHFSMGQSLASKARANLTLVSFLALCVTLFVTVSLLPF